MDLDGQPNSMPGQWPGTSTLDYHRPSTPPPFMSPNVNGPVDPNEFYMSFSSPTEAELQDDGLSTSQYRMDSGRPDQVQFTPSRSFSRSPTRKQLRSVSSPTTTGIHSLISAKSNPVLTPSRQPGNVKDIANRFDLSAASAKRYPQIAVKTGQEGYRQTTAASRGAASKSPTSASSSDGRAGLSKLQKRRPGPRSPPRKSPSTSFETSTSFSSNGTARTSKSQPQPAKSPRASSRPLFGEITADGQWNGNFDLSNYAPLPTFHSVRRGSDSSVALGHGRSQSHQDFSHQRSQEHARHKLNHKRSRSDMDGFSSPVVAINDVPALYPTPPNSQSRIGSNPSRIPVISRRQSSETAASHLHSRSTSALSNPANPRLQSKSPTPTKPVMGKENAPSPATRGRYNLPPLSSPQSNQMLSAKIVVPPPKTSPPLRSSRPRQPVSSATTSASRARAAERFQGTGAKDGRRPSEQWLGKPYDPQKERSKRKIPELGMIDFEERRARIQKAISQNLETSGSQESLRSLASQSSRSRSRLASHENPEQASGGAEDDGQDEMEQLSASVYNPDTDQLRRVQSEQPHEHSRGLSIETTGIADPTRHDDEPLTGQTDQTEQTVFEDESPILGRPSTEHTKNPPVEEPILLSSAIYQAPSKAAPPPTIHVPERDADVGPPLTSPSLLENVMRMRQRSASSMNTGSEYPDEGHSLVGSIGDLGGRWDTTQSPPGDQGSIKIMLDDDPAATQAAAPWSDEIVSRIRDVQHHGHTYEDELQQAREFNRQAFNTNGILESPIEQQESFTEDSAYATPRRAAHRDETLKPAYEAAPAVKPAKEVTPADDSVARALRHYESTGTLTPEMLEHMQHHMVDLYRLSANGGSNAFMVQNLLDSILDEQASKREQSMPNGQIAQDHQLLKPLTYEMPPVTPDTPPPEDFTPGTVLVYGNETAAAAAEEDFEAKIRKADEQWERQQHGEMDGPADVVTSEDEHKPPPPPPPKDAGYTPRLSTVPNSATFPSHPAEGLRISTASPLDLASIHAAGDQGFRSANSAGNHAASPVSPAPPLPGHAPPAPPSAIPHSISDGTYSARASSDLSPRVRKDPWAATGSSRPSIDSQRLPAPLPASQSMSSIEETTRQTSLDNSRDGSARPTITVSPGPEQKRLLKRRHIIKELLDTENTYHQDLKIVEDIYKGTCTEDLVPPEDKKVLFGNCHDVEKFALKFYDEMRKAASPVYIPAKSQRWAGKRNSHSTTQSDGTTHTSLSDAVDDEKDRQTTLGKCFLENIAEMEIVYTTYLKNHDFANARLKAIQDVVTVKCWLTECQSNASDITSAWSLDSLLVKPTQRIVKYPLLLQTLLEVTPADHGDYEDLKTANQMSLDMLNRINDAKKREDLVNQIINPKQKQGVDLRSGFAKIVGRRTEKLKERVGIAELHQDPEFDELAHKFGGHFIRLQICMRDVQNYMNATNKAVDLITNYASALELYTDVSPSNLPEIESKWRRYGQVIRDLTGTAFEDHRAAVLKRVLNPMLLCIKLHEGPQNAISKRKKRVVDYAKCKADERRGVKPDKKTVDAAEGFTALNDQLKIELPKLYRLTAALVQKCLHCFLDIQLKWHNTWERKLRPLLEAADIPADFKDIELAFRLDYMDAQAKCLNLSVCNGLLRADTGGLLSPSTTLVDSSEAGSSKRRPSTVESGASTPNRRHSGAYAPDHQHYYHDGRIRSNSSMSARPTPSHTASSVSVSRPWSNSVASTPHTSYNTSRPGTATTPSGAYSTMRASSDNPRSPRPGSNATYFTVRPEQADNQQYTGLYSSALPVEDHLQSSRPQSRATESKPTNVQFVCASLFEFSIDKGRRENGYPYLTYVQGEVFDVVDQKGELWLAKNQDDTTETLGWIWEQHFVILSQSDQ